MLAVQLAPSCINSFTWKYWFAKAAKHDKKSRIIPALWDMTEKKKKKKKKKKRVLNAGRHIKSSVSSMFKPILIAGKHIKSNVQSKVHFKISHELSEKSEP